MVRPIQEPNEPGVGAIRSDGLTRYPERRENNSA